MIAEIDANPAARDRTGNHMPAVLQLALGMIVFGSATPVSKIVTEHMPVFIASGLRVGVGAVVLLPFAWVARGALSRLSARDWWLVLAIALFGMVGFTALMLYGMRMISGVAGSIVMATTPAVTAAAAVVFFGEHWTWRKIGAVALSFLGVALLQTAGVNSEQDAGGLLGATLLGSLMVFGAVCCEAAYRLLGRKLSRDSDPRLVAFLAAALSLPLFALLSIWQWPEFDAAAVEVSDWAAVAWYGAGTLALGTLLWYSGIARTQGSVAAGFMGLMPVSALVLSYVLLGEAFRVMHLAGFAIVFAGVLLISREHARAAD